MLKIPPEAGERGNKRGRGKKVHSGKDPNIRTVEKTISQAK